MDGINSSPCKGYYNLIYREEEREMIPYCRANGIGLIPWSPNARGALARPFDSRSTLRENTDKGLHGLVRSKEDDVDELIIGRVEEIAKKYNVSMATIAISWCLLKGTNPIVGFNKKERIDEAVNSVHFANSGKLSQEDIEYLESGYMPKAIKGY